MMMAIYRCGTGESMLKVSRELHLSRARISKQLKALGVTPLRGKPQPKVTPHSHLGLELAWAAGFIEGEGSISVWQSRQRVRKGQPRISVVQTHTAPLIRLQEALGEGKIRGPFIPNNGISVKPQWRWYTTSAPVSIYVITVLWPYLTSNFQEKVKERWGSEWQTR
jgi:hypothetical protein